MKKAIIYQNEECVLIKTIKISDNNFAFFVKVKDRKIIYLKENFVRDQLTYASLDKLVNLFPKYQTPGIFNTKVMLDTFANTINYKIKTGEIVDSDEILEIINQFEKIINDPYIKEKTSLTEKYIFSNDAMRQVTDTIKKLDGKTKKTNLSGLLHTTEETQNDVFLSQNWLNEEVVDNKALLYASIEKSNKAHKRSFIDFLFNNKVLNVHMVIVVVAAVGFASCLQLLFTWKKTGKEVSTEIDKLREDVIIVDPHEDDDELINSNVIDPTIDIKSNKTSNKSSNKTSNKKSNKTSNSTTNNSCYSRFGTEYCAYTNVSVLNIDFKKLLKQNSDTVGYIYINNTNVNYPVVQSRDNSYYLDHDFNGKKNVAGWIYADYRADFKNFTKKNTIIYGHGRTDKVMFGSLEDALSPSWYKNSKNQVIKISTPTRDTLWQIVSIYVKKQESYYLTVNFEDDKKYKKWIDTIVGRSVYNFGYKKNVNDKFLTLSTCKDYKGNRIVIHAVLVKNEKKK